MDIIQATEILRRSNIFDQIHLIQILRECQYLFVNGSDTLSEELLKIKAITKSVLGNAFLWDGKFYPKNISPELYSFGDIFDRSVILSRNILEKIKLNKSISNIEKETWTYEMNVAVSKYVSIVRPLDCGTLPKDFKSSIFKGNKKDLMVNELACGIIAELTNGSNGIETDSKGVQLFNCLNWEKECVCKDVNDCEYDADIDEKDNICDTDIDDDDDDFDVQCINSSLFSLARTSNSLWLNESASNYRKSDCALLDNEWIKDFIKIKNQKARKKLPNQSIPSCKHSHACDLQLDKEDSVTQDLFGASPEIIIQDIEKASDFERFILLELPNIPSDYEPSFDEEENYKLWEAAIEEEKAKCFLQSVPSDNSSNAEPSYAKATNLKGSKKKKKSLCFNTTQKQFTRGKNYSAKFVNNKKKGYKSLRVKRAYVGRGLRYIKKYLRHQPFKRNI